VKSSSIWLFAGILLSQFVLFEAGLRIKGGSEAAPAFQRLFMTDPRIGHRLRPGARSRFTTSEFDTDIAINREGTRDDEIGPKAPGERRIVVLGDSLVMAVQVELQQTFCKRLEADLNARYAAPGERYRVINAGVQGYGPVEELLFYQHIASHFDADLVIVAVFVGNDAMEASDSSGKLQATDARVNLTRAKDSALLTVRRVVRRSMVLQILRMRALEVAGRFGQVRPIDRALTMYLPSLPAEMERGLDVARDCIREIARLAAARGARTAIVLIPARFQVDDDDCSRLRAIVAGEGETLVRDAASERFARALAPLSLPMMDALPLLRAVPPSDRVFFESTVHLTPRGHQVVADGLARFLADSRLIGAPPVTAVAPASR
jgi:hypothetical protein